MTRSSFSRAGMAALGLAATLGLAMPASADVIRVSYAGTLTDVSGSRLGDFFDANAPVVGGAFSGGFEFTWGTPDSNPTRTSPSTAAATACSRSTSAAAGCTPRWPATTRAKWATT
jgi:hypothetical protein